MKCILCSFFIKEGGPLKSQHLGGCCKARAATRCSGRKETSLKILLHVSLQA